MTDLFLKIVNMSISAAWLSGAVMLARLALKKAPKWVPVLLWGMVALRLLCPFTLESALSLMPKAQTISPEIMMSPSPSVDSGIEIVDAAVNPVLSESFSPNPGTSANPLQILIPVASCVWMAGAAIMGLYTLLSYWRIRRRVRMAIRVEPDIYLSEYVDSPFVLGVLQPRIYIPYHMNAEDLRHVIAHERIHIKRKDHWWKPLGFALLTVHWFNPVLWLAYGLLCRDIELACDEWVIRAMEPEQRADYSQALLNCSVHSRSITACPLAFGEVGVTTRVKHVLSYKKPEFWVVVIALALCIVVAVCFLTDPDKELAEKIVEEDGYRIFWEMDVPQFDIVLPKYDLSSDALVTSDRTLFALYDVTPGSAIYLKNARYTEESQEYLYLTFAIAYDEAQQENRILLPYILTQEAHSPSLTLLSKDVRDRNGTTFHDACSFSGQGTGSEFSIILKAEVWDQAVETVAFQLDGFQVLFYQKNRLFRDSTPYPITRNLANYRETLDTSSLTLFQEKQAEITLSQADMVPLLDALSHLIPPDFENGAVTQAKAMLVLRFGETMDQELQLIANGDQVQFVFMGKAAQAMDNLSWCVRNDALNAFFADFLPQNDAVQWGVSLRLETVNNTGATVVFQAPSDANLFTGNSYTLEQWADGHWTAVPALQEPVFTTVAFPLSNLRRFTIDWEWLYGELPAGQYRIYKEITKRTSALAGVSVPTSQAGVVYAEFTLEDPVHTPYDVTHSFGAENAQASAEFVSGGGGYSFFPDESQKLAAILRNLEEKDFFPATVLDVETIISVCDPETSLRLHSNGKTVGIDFDGETGWAVEDDALNDFIRKINRHSQAESIYAIYNAAPLEELDSHYTIEEAVMDKVVVMVEGDVQYNQDVWREFDNKAHSGQDAWVRCMEVYPELTFFYDIEFDRNRYTLRTLSGGEITEKTYAYLQCYSARFREGAAADQFTYYVLVNDQNVTWNQLQESLYSSQFGAAIPHSVVYRDIAVFPEEPEPKAGAVLPEMIYGIQSARLNWKQAELTLSDPVLLDILEDMLRSSVPVKGMECPAENNLTLTLASSRQIHLNIASDSCGIWESGGIYYRYAGENEGFYALFAPELWENSKFSEAGLSDGGAFYRYVNWSYFDRVCGIDETLSLMNGLFHSAMQNRTFGGISTAMYRVNGLDGAYAEYFSSLLNELYEKTPHDFSKVCMEAPEDVRETLIALLGHARGIQASEAEQLILDHLTGSS